MTEIIKVKEDELKELACIAKEIWQKHYYPIVDKSLVDYMLEKFQSESAIKSQIRDDGYTYFWTLYNDEKAGYFAIYPRQDMLYLSKFYLLEEFRGRGISIDLMRFIKEKAKKLMLKGVFLNVNKNNAPSIKAYEHLGFEIIKKEKADIGNGFFTDDYIMECRF